jgi:hypothetical protein
MTHRALSIVKFPMAIIGGCLLFICASIAVHAQGGSGTLVNAPAKPTTPAKSASSKSSKTKKSPTTSKASGARRTNNAKEAAAATERTFWESIRTSSNPEDFRAYLNKYPSGEFVDLAKNKLRTLEAAQAKSKDNSRSSENTSPSWQMVGVWRANSTEFGYSWEITYTAKADGTYQYFARNSQGGTVQDYGLWQYSDGILYQKFSNGASGKGSVEWLDRNTFLLTIIDNGTPAYNGVKRRYHRVK